MEENSKNSLFIQQLVDVDQVRLNLTQSVIVITEDKLRLHLQSHLSIVERKKDWVAPFSVLVSISLALLTANFKNLIFSADTWKALFIVMAILSFLWLCTTLRQAFYPHSIESLIKEINSEAKSKEPSNFDETEGAENE